MEEAVRHRVAGKKLNRTKDEAKQLRRNLMVSLILHEKIKTTEAKAKAIRAEVEKLVTIAKEDSHHHRGLVLSALANPRATAKLFEVIAPRMADRPGGYTRMFRLGQRQGDGAQMVQLEFVGRQGA